MTTETTMSVRNSAVRNAGPRAPLEAAQDSRTANASPVPGRDGASTRDADADPASRPFAESMTQAMRRAQSKSADEARESGKEPANDDRDAAGNETAGAGDETAASSTAAASGAKAAFSTAEDPKAATAANEAATIAVSTATTGTAISTSTSDANRGSADDASATQGDTRADAAASPASRAAVASAAADTTADASLGDDLQSAATEAAENASGNAQARAPGADAPQLRSTADFSAQLAQLRGAAATTPAQAADGVGTTPSPAPAGLYRTEVAAPVGDALFPNRFAAEVALLGSAGIERAEIRLQPRELGPVRIELSMSGESARIAFSAVQPETRQAIEQSLPILKDMLAERGLMLGDTSVSDGHAERGSADPQANPSQAASDGSAVGGDDRPFTADARRTTSRRTLLDVYA